jgi:hypothetical protein
LHTTRILNEGEEERYKGYDAKNRVLKEKSHENLKRKNRNFDNCSVLSNDLFSVDRGDWDYL